MMRCKLCGRKIKYPVWIDGKTYGSSCAKKISNSSVELDVLRKEVDFLRTQVRELQLQIQNTKQDVWTPLPKVPSNGDSKPIGLGYGMDHNALMDELRLVLAQRGAN